MKIALIGYGKMGKTIEHLALAAGDEVVLKIGSNNLTDLTVDNLQKAEVAIDFSQPDSAFNNIKISLEAGVPIISGTTAWLDRLEEAKDLCNRLDGAFFYASNFSVGVNIFFALNEILAKSMNAHEQYDVSMEEIHHTQKLDAPSGTAITLADGILANLNRKENWVNDSSDKKEAIDIISKRIDKVPGTHEVIYQSAVDSISIKHTAHSREGFAKGALQAARWLIGKRGFFGMRDMLGI